MRQYALIITENNLLAFKAVFPELHYIEIQGMNLNGESKHQVLVTPVHPTVTPVAETEESEKELPG